MIDRIFSAALTFCLLIAGTLAIAAAMFGMDRPASPLVAKTAQVRVIELPRVVIVGQRVANADASVHVAHEAKAATAEATTLAKAAATEPATQVID